MSAERGSVLMLVPAAVLTLVVLAAIAVDAAVVFLAQRELADAAAGAANDAAVAALDERTFYEDGRLRIDPARAGEVALTSVAARRMDWLDAAPPRVEVEMVGGEAVRVRVTASGTAQLIFARSLPGAVDRMTVTAASVATAETGR